MRVFDSNTLIYYLNGVFSPRRRAQINDWIQEEALVSVITRIEVLGYTQPDREQDRVNRFLALFQEISLEEEIVRATISIRRQHSIGVPDAIIAATALDLDVPLVTRNTSDFEAIEGLVLVNPFED